MIIQDKIEAIKYLKNNVVKYQQYELAAWLRDVEKNLLSEAGYPTTYNPKFAFKIRYPQYYYLIEVLDNYEKTHFNSGSTKIHLEDLKNNCIDIIREQKINELFGNDSTETSI